MLGRSSGSRNDGGGTTPSCPFRVAPLVPNALKVMDSMNGTFHPCAVPWRIWPWGLTLHHEDTDVLPACSVEFGVLMQPGVPSEELWVRVDFEAAAFASASPHRDDEDLADVTGYDIVPRRTVDGPAERQLEEEEWNRTELCPDPGFYFSTDSAWLDRSRRLWADRQRMDRSPQDAVHFLMDGRDGYLEILASGFTWRAWYQGCPILSAVEGEPVLGGAWSEQPARAEKSDGQLA